MHWLDISVGVALLIGGVWSFGRGLSREVLVLLGTVAALALAVWGYTSGASLLDRLFAPGWLRQAAGAGVVVLGAAGLTAGWTLLVYRLVTGLVLSPVDRVLGGLFGMVKAGVMVAAVFLVMARFFPDATARMTTGARCAPALLHTARTLTLVLPERMAAAFQRVGRHRQQLQPAGSSVPAAAETAAPPPASAVSSDGISESDSRALEHMLHRQLREQ